MELLYIWINRVKNICKQGYNFSMRNRFDVIIKNGKAILNEIDKQSNLENFFDKRYRWQE